jgi:uncharacterized protein
MTCASWPPACKPFSTPLADVMDVSDVRDRTVDVEALPGLQLAPAHLNELRQILRQHVPYAQVWAYGSRVTGGGHEGSDLDLVLRRPGYLDQAFPQLEDLREAFQQSPLPMLVDVHDWARLPATFHRNIERRYLEIQAGSAAA